MSTESVLLITLGDPDGLGPELTARLQQSRAEFAHQRTVIIGPRSAYEPYAQSLGIDAPPPIDEARAADPPAGVSLFTPPETADFSPKPGRARVEGGRCAGVSLDAACRLMKGFRENGRSAALVTCPLNKATLNEAGYSLSGHTEFLAERFDVGVDKVCMHLCGPLEKKGSEQSLRVSLVTTHPPLKDVPELVTREKILHCLRLTAQMLARLGLFDAPIAVCGLNPHAGESGRIGDEEVRIIRPAVEKAASEGLNVVGPLPGDTVFHFAAKGRYAATLAMYHDQGLAPLKLLHFGEAVNVTLGLPIVRTSPDHGTGYDLVGTGNASTSGLENAMDLALRLAGDADG